MSELEALDASRTQNGRDNWETCLRMVMHDLIDLSYENEQIKKLKDFYSINFTEDGGYTLRLPRYMTTLISKKASDAMGIIKQLENKRKRGRPRGKAKKT